MSPAPFAGDPRPLCDRKAVPLSAAQNAAANFFVMTDVPIVANGSGLVNNDLANAFDPNAPTFGEKYAPPYVPIAFYDWNGNLVNRVYSDQFGRYNAVLPSTYSVNLPMPSGRVAEHAAACINDAGPIANPDSRPTRTHRRPSSTRVQPASHPGLLYAAVHARDDHLSGYPGAARSRPSRSRPPSRRTASVRTGPP